MCQNTEYKELLTIYTPTFNRSKYLSCLYESLRVQTDKRFIWYIVDDGSIDDTEEKVKEWKKEAPFRIEYRYKKNEGVHTARDLAYRLVETELIVGIDSDDQLLPNAVEIILKKWDECEDHSDVCGLITLVQNDKGIILDKNFPKVSRITYQQLTYKYKSTTDHTIVLRSDIIKKIPNAPVFKNEKLVNESYKWIQLPQIPFLVLRESTVVHSYLENGYTQNVRKNWFNNLNGYLALYNQQIKSNLFFKYRFYFAIKYMVAAIFLKKKDCIKKSNSPLLTFFVTPIAYLVYCYMLAKYNSYSRLSKCTSREKDHE